MRGGSPSSSASHSTGTAIKFAVAVARDDVDESDGRQRAPGVHAAPALLDGALIGKSCDHALERDAILALDPEGPGDFTDADFSGAAGGFLLAGDESENVLAGWLRSCLDCQRFLDGPRGRANGFSKDIA